MAQRDPWGVLHLPTVGLVGPSLQGAGTTGCQAPAVSLSRDWRGDQALVSCQF